MQIRLMNARRYKLDELARAADVSARTVRYYVQRGLLPPPTFRGPDTSYGADHLARLRRIKELQARHLPLDEIQVALDGGPIPAPVAPSKKTHLHVTTWRRVTLAPGLELGLADDADAEARALFETLKRRAEHGEGADE